MIESLSLKNSFPSDKETQECYGRPTVFSTLLDASGLPIQGEEFRFGNMVFTSKFDSGNLQKVEKVNKDQSTSDSKFLSYKTHQKDVIKESF